jgi:hypothetical protein
MSISFPQPPGPPVEDWDALAALEVSRQRDIDAAFDRVDACEREGRFGLALEWLELANDLSGSFTEASRVQQARLAGKLRGALQ